MGIYFKLIVEGVVPYFLHDVPVGDDSLLDGVCDVHDSSFLESLVTHGVVALVKGNIEPLEPGSSKQGWEALSRSNLSRKSRLHHSSPVINHDGGEFSFVHFLDNL